MSSRTKIFLISAILLISNRFYNLTLVPNNIYQGLIVLALFVVFFLLLIYKRKSNVKYLFKNEVGLLLVLPVISVISAIFFHNQSILYSFAALLFVYFWLFYFLIHKLDPNPEKLIRIVTTLGIIWAIISIIQQFTFPYLLFNRSIKFDTYDFVVRSRHGIIRYAMMGVNLCVFAAVFFWFEILTKKFRLKNGILFLITFMALILTGSRQIIASIFFVIIFSLLFDNRLTSVKFFKVLIPTILFGILAFKIGGSFFEYLLKLSERQGIGSNSFQRWIELKFFLFNYWPITNKWFAFLFGNGWEYPASAYGHEINNVLRETKMLSRSDIGLFGAINKGGFLYFSVSLLVYYKVLIKYKVKKQYQFIKMFFIQNFLTAWTGKIFFEYLPTITLIIIILYIFEYANQDFINNTNPQPN